MISTLNTWSVRYTAPYLCIENSLPSQQQCLWALPPLLLPLPRAVLENCAYHTDKLHTRTCSYKTSNSFQDLYLHKLSPNFALQHHNHDPTWKTSLLINEYLDYPTPKSWKRRFYACAPELYPTNIVYKNFLDVSTVRWRNSGLSHWRGNIIFVWNKTRYRISTPSELWSTGRFT